MTKKKQIQAYRNELSELEIQEQLTKRTINTITRRKRVLINALDELGASSAFKKNTKKGALNERQVLNLKASITKKPRGNEAH